MRSIGGLVLEQWARQMGTQHNTWHIPNIAQKCSSHHDMSCPSKGITYDFVGHSAAKTAFTLPHWI